MPFEVSRITDKDTFNFDNISLILNIRLQYQG
jgi:uncharacterized protein YkuJ